MECDDVRDQLADFLDEDAVAELCREIEAHMKHCPNCRVYVDTIRKTVVLYQADDRSRTVQVPVRVNARLSAMLADEYRRAGAVEALPSD